MKPCAAKRRERGDGLRERYGSRPCERLTEPREHDEVSVEDAPLKPAHAERL
jgi:hypothetical protein